MATGKPQKRIYLVNRDFQLRYAKSAMVVGFVSTVLTTILILWPLYAFEILRIPRFLPAPILVLMCVPIVINIFFIAFMGILLTHKIAGPMYSLIRYMRQVERGNYAAVARLREGDELKYVIRNFNCMVESLVISANEDLDMVKKLTFLLQALKARHDEKGLEEALSMIETLEAKYCRKLANTSNPKKQMT